MHPSVVRSGFGCAPPGAHAATPRRHHPAARRHLAKQRLVTDSTMTTAVPGRTFDVPVKRYRIGELVRHTPLSRQTIHNYTIMGLIRETEWTDGGHRLYDESVFNRLVRIIELRKTKTLSQIRKILAAEEPQQDRHVASSASSHPAKDGPSRRGYTKKQERAT